MEYYESLEKIKKSNKPILLYFTSSKSINCRIVEKTIQNSVKIKNLIKTDYDLIVLYTDDRTLVKREKWIIDEKKQTLNTIGKINGYLQKKKFQNNLQPLFVITDKTEKIYGMIGLVSKDKFIKFLENNEKRN